MDKSFTVHDLPPSERPRERLAHYGAEALSSQELLALVLGRGIRGESVMVTAQKLISQFGNLRNLALASPEELAKVRGIGPAKAAQIKAVFELNRRMEDSEYYETKTPIRNPEDVASFVQSALKDKKKEHFVAVLLDTRNRVIKKINISIGSLETSLVHPREVFKEAIAASAASMIVAHNHPSGDVQPSEDDLRITRRLKEVGELMGIEVLDHIIVGGSSHLSFKSKGLL